MELKRLKDAFKRTSGLTCYMTQQCFYREVLGDGVPPKVAEVSPSVWNSDDLVAVRTADWLIPWMILQPVSGNGSLTARGFLLWP